MARVPANTRFGHEVAVLDFAGTGYLGTFTNVGLSVDSDVSSMRAVGDTWDVNQLIVSGMTLDFSRCTEGTLPLMILAASSNPTFTAKIKHSSGGVSFTGLFLITEATWTAEDGPQSERITAVLCGNIATTVVTGASEVRTPADTLYGHHVSMCTLDAFDALLYFTRLGVSIRVDTAEAHAIADTFRYPKMISRSCTLDLSKVVEDTTPLMDLAIAQAEIACSIEIASGMATIGGNFVPQTARLEMPDGPMNESITLVCNGPLTVAA